MGLQNELSDVSSESMLVYMVVLIGKSVSYLHSLLFTFLHLFRFDPHHHDNNNNNIHHLENSLYDVVGSGLANIILLCEQLNLNRACSYANQSDGGEGLGRGLEFDSDCVVCLNRLGEREQLVRRLACGHVFHKDCFDGWLDHLNFSCPLCSAPLVSDERVECAGRRVAGYLLAWFPFQ